MKIFTFFMKIISFAAKSLTKIKKYEIMKGDILKKKKKK